MIVINGLPCGNGMHRILFPHGSLTGENFLLRSKILSICIFLLSKVRRILAGIVIKKIWAERKLPAQIVIARTKFI